MHAERRNVIGFRLPASTPSPYALSSSKPMHTIEISDEAYEAAKRTAALDSIDVPTLVESLVHRHAEYIRVFQEVPPAMRPFSLEHYEMDRVPGESEEDYRTG